MPFIVLGTLVVLVAARTRFPDYLFHWDEVQLTLGLDRFDVRTHQPHPPGYYLFVLLGRLLLPFVGTAENALRWVAALGAAGVAGLICGAVPRGVGPLARAGYAAAAAAFVLCSPLVLFHAVSALTYTLEAAAWLAILLTIGRRPRGAALWGLAIGIGVAGGVRPTLVVWGLAIVTVKWLLDRRWLDGPGALRLVAGVALGVVSWAGPMLAEAGGFGAYLDAVVPTLRGNVWEKSIFHEGASAALARATRLVVDLWLAAGLLLVAAAVGMTMRLFGSRSTRIARWDSLPIGSVIPFVFYTLLIYDSDGYVLVTAVPLAAYGVLSAAALFESRGPGGQLGGALLTLSLAAGTLPLTASPDRGYPSYAAHDAALEARIGAIRRSFKPAETVLVTSHEYWQWGFRHVMYYLPEYTTVQLVPDRFYADAGPERPYLTARDHEIGLAGPDGLDVRSLADSVRQVVYVIPHDVTVYVAPSCARFIRPFPTTPDETLGLLRLTGGFDVRVSRAQLHCVAPGRDHGQGPRLRGRQTDAPCGRDERELSVP